MLPASLAACVPVFMATPTSACASAGASLVPSPVIATSLPAACSCLISAILSSGVASARKSSTPASLAIAAAVSGLSPVIITVLMPIARSAAKRSRMPPLMMSLRWITPSTRLRSATTSGVPPARAMRSTMPVSSGRGAAAVRGDVFRDRIAAPFRISRPSKLTPDMRVCAVNGTNSAAWAAKLAAADVVLLLGQHDDRSAFRRFVGERRQLRGVGQGRLRHAWQRDELTGLTVAERDRAGLVEQQRVHVAGSFDGAARHRQHVVLDQPIHAGDADRRQQPADRRRNQAHQQRDQHEHRLRRAGVDRKRLQRDHRHQEHDGQAGQQDVERDLVRRLLPLGAFDERDHAIEERVARVGRDLDLDPVRQHARAAGDRRSIAAGLADDRRRFTGDRRFVDRRHAFDDFAVRRDEFAGLHQHDVAAPQRRGRHRFRSGRSGDQVRDGFGARLAQRVGLRLAASFGHRLGQVREQDRRPQPQRDLQLEADAAAAVGDVAHAAAPSSARRRSRRRT